MSGRRRFILWFAASLLAACASLETPPVPARVASYTLNVEPQAALAAALAVAPGLGLKVKTPARVNNYVQFRRHGLSPEQLQSYCIYPGLHGQAPKQWQNFQSWSLDSVRDGMGPISGSIELSLQVSANPGGGSKISTRSTLEASTSARGFPCESTGVLESEFQNALGRQAGS